MNATFTRWAGAGAVFALVAAPVTADAVTTPRSYQGSDYSANSSTGKTVYACDAENDGHDVSADFYRTGSGSLFYVVDRYGNGCSSTGTGSGIVYKHRAVELVPLSTDYYGAWAYPQ